MQVYACLVPVLEQQAVEEGFTVIHGEELMLDINTGTYIHGIHGDWCRGTQVEVLWTRQ
jgi:hypothetical protein